MRRLFDKTQIKQMSMKNRLIRSATWENMADSRGGMTDRLFQVYEDLAKGGVGTIITGYAFVTRDEQPNPGMMGIYDDAFIEEYAPLTEAVHRHGSRIILQISYGGSQTTYRTEKRLIWGPSAIPEKGTKVVPKEIDHEEIRYLVRSFGAAAVRAKAAGFDGVQIHGAHGYLLGQFLSPLHNIRTDEYGGPIENRARIIFEVYEEIRRKVGEDFPLFIKVNSEDFVEGGASFADCRYVCMGLAKRGIDAIEISGGTISAGDLGPGRSKITTADKEAYFSGAAALVAEDVDVPVILVGGLRSPEVMERLLRETKITYFSLSRPFLTEPDLVSRWSAGDRQRAKCISCNQCRSQSGNGCAIRERLLETENRVEGLA